MVRTKNMVNFNDLLKLLHEAELTNPLNVQEPDGTLSTEELVAAVRQSIIAEQDAIVLYETYANATDNKDAKEIFEHIIEDEKHHLGEFQVLLESLVPDESEQVQKGRDEADNIIGKSEEQELEQDEPEEDKEFDDV